MSGVWLILLICDLKLKAFASSAVGSLESVIVSWRPCMMHDGDFGPFEQFLQGVITYEVTSRASLE